MHEHRVVYQYGQDLWWKYKIIKSVFKAYNEPMLNLHFMGPYLKSNLSSINMYDLIFYLMSVLPDVHKRNLL